ncbi:hypothetical protein [Pedobacter sp. V48]|uniref:hypothetical protein n=1 Tax=Pedobacter sp. V48 TaxID=509635 RepID=UPI0003E5A754|nr:hypothetical protein [Pedobacter sp. V48]ETZ22428.1 hypothetical protein N824_01905 [Pedobacter sp. V48]
MRISQKEILYSSTFRMILISIVALLLVSLCVRKIASNKFDAVVKEVCRIEMDCYQTQKVLGIIKQTQACYYQGVQDLTAGDDVTYRRNMPYVFSELMRVLNQKEDVATLTTKQVIEIRGWYIEKQKLRDRLHHLKEKYESLVDLYPKAIGKPNMEGQLNWELKKDIGLKLKNVIFDATVINNYAAHNFKSIAITNYQEAIRWSSVFCLTVMVLGVLILLYTLSVMIVEFWDDRGYNEARVQKD